MIKYNRFLLDNGLRVLHSEEKDGTSVVLNILYNVGARDEDPDKTGFAHLFEHLMFGGSLHIPEYDKAVEQAGGSNNAFTNNDFTNYYISVPAENAEIAFWLESDRMLQLAFSEKVLTVQKGVVLEEFRQRCYNAPLGQLWHHVRTLLYKKHPYSWPTIGKELSHIENATLEDVKDFYFKHYHPGNAILSITGNITPDRAKMLAEKWFGSIERTGIVNQNHYEPEDPQMERRFFETTDMSPSPAVFLMWRCPGYTKQESRMAEMFAEMLGGTETSPLTRILVKEKHFFNAAESFCMRSLDDSIFMVYGLLNEGISHKSGEEMLADIMREVANGKWLTEHIFQGVKNRIRSHRAYENLSPMNIAQHLGFYELIGDAEMINKESDLYAELSLESVLEFASKTFLPQNPSVIYYHPINDHQQNQGS